MGANVYIGGGMDMTVVVDGYVDIYIYIYIYIYICVCRGV